MFSTARASTLRPHAVALALLLLVLTGGVAQARDIQRMTFPVTLSDGRTYTVVGYLHSHQGAAGKPLQVLLHGATYTHAYWDLPEFDGQSYSYAEYMVNQGYAVLALDLLGSGESSRPEGDFLELSTLADSIHQVVVSLRTGKNQFGTSWQTIFGVGHSLGSATAIYVQATYRDFNAIVSTGMGHVPHPMPINPEFHNRAMAKPYFYMAPEERAGMFHHPAVTTQEIINYDTAQFGGPLSRGLYQTVMVATFDASINRVGEVRGPVLVQLGEHDFLFPTTYGAEEPHHWPHATVTVQSVAGVGHSFNMHQGRRESWRMIDGWLRPRLPARATVAGK